MSDPIANMILQYGIAGVVIYLFYRLICNELKELKETISKLTNKISKLTDKIDKLTDKIK